MSPYAWPCSAPCLWKAKGELKVGYRQQQTGLGATRAQGRSWAQSFSSRRLSETPGEAIFRGLGSAVGSVSVFGAAVLSLLGVCSTSSIHTAQARGASKVLAGLPSSPAAEADFYPSSTVGKQRHKGL